MELRKSIFSLCSKKPNFYVAAFHHKLVFGPVSGQPEVFEVQSFQVDYCDYHKIYIDFFKIVKCLSGSQSESTGSLIDRYQWKITNVNNEVHILFIAKNEELFFKISFSLNEFNDLVYLISELCFLTLNLSLQNLTFFLEISKCETDEILSFQNKEKLKKAIKLLDKDNELDQLGIYCASQLISYNLDVIICVHKLRSFYNEKASFTLLNIEAMNGCE